MKTLTKIIPRIWPMLLALIFLSSCYEFVYVTQEDDVHQFCSLKTKISVRVINNEEKPHNPYFGMLMPIGWQVINGIHYTQEVNGLSIKIGVVHYSHKLTMKMQSNEPAPQNYYWWVGEGTTGISKSGIYNIYPQIMTNKNTGTFDISYMFGDSYNGLNKLRSEVKKVEVIDKYTPSDLTLKVKENSVNLNWKHPLYSVGLLGYDIYRNEKKINNGVVIVNSYQDELMVAGNYSYSVFPVYIHKNYGSSSLPACICFSHKGPSIQFDGQNDRMIVYDKPSLQIKHTMTLEAWIRTAYSEPQDQCIISKGYGDSGYELRLNNSLVSQKLLFVLPVGKIMSKQIIIPGSWYHVAAVYDGELMKLYINGKLDSSVPASGIITTNDVPLIIGRSSTALNTHFSGNIDDVRIWKVARTAEQIRGNFTSMLSGKEDGLVGYWPIQEGCSFSTCDISPGGSDGYLTGCCWCGKEFPFAENTNNQTNPQLVIPIMNYDPINLKPEKIELEFKINPQLLQFQGVIIENTQLSNFSKVMTFYSKDGTIRITATNDGHGQLLGDVLVYLDFKSLSDKFITKLDFYSFKSDQEYLRTFSGQVVVAEIVYKSQSENTESEFLEAAGFTFNLYPNPASNVLNIELYNLNQNTILQVFNNLGQVILEERIFESKARVVHLIDVSQFGSGVYFISVTNDGQRNTKKFFVN